MQSGSPINTPLLDDEWALNPILLDGPAERGGFPPVLLAFAAILGAFVLFQIIISPLAIVLLLMAQGLSPQVMLASFETLLADHARTLLSANTIGQVLGLAIPAYILARLSSSQAGSFLRMRRVEPVFILLSVLGLAALVPVVQWLGAINQELPIPEAFEQFEQSQIEMIETILRTETSVMFNLIVLAITPALCEELLFRGYFQRQLERGVGVLWGIALSGVVFGLYHLRLTQVLPLSLLGVYLAYLTWRTGSLWPAIVVHFANNGLAVIVADFIRRREDIDMDVVDGLTVPWYVVVLSIALFSAVVYVLHIQAGRRVAETGPEAQILYRPDDPPTTTDPR